MSGIYLKVLLFLLPIFVQSLSKCLRAYFVLGTVDQALINLLSCPWKIKHYYHVFWLFDVSFLLNQLSCVVCSFVYKLFLPWNRVVCGRWTMGWNGPGALRSWDQLLHTCCSQQLCPSVGFLPLPSSFWPMLCISLFQNPEGTCQTIWVSAIVLTGWAQPQDLLVILWMGIPWTGACYPHPSALLPTLLLVRSCYNQRGSSLVCSVLRLVRCWA